MSRILRLRLRMAGVKKVIDLMWMEIKKARTLMVAEMWKELFEGEGIPTRIMPEKGLPVGQEFAVYKILIPEDKHGIVTDILRKL